MYQYGEKTLLWVILAIGIPLVVLLATGQLNNATSLGTVIVFGIALLGMAMLYEKYDTVRYIQPIYNNPITNPIQNA